MARLAGTTILDRHLGLTIFGGVAMVLSVLLALSLFFGFIAELDNTGEHYGLVQALQYVLLGMPELAAEMIPVAMLIGTMMGLGNLASNSELIVLRASGVSMWRLAFAVAITGMAVGCFHYVLSDWVAPITGQHARVMKAEAGGSGAGTRLAGSLWFRDGGRIIQFRDLDSSESIGNVEVFDLNPRGTIDMAGQAEQVSHEGVLWTFSEWKATHFIDDHAQVNNQERKVWDTQVTPELLSLLVVKPGDFSAVGLYRYISYLKRNGLESDQYELALWKKLLAPLSVIFMGLLALPFVFGPMRSAAVGQRLLAGVLIGLGYYMFNKIFADAGFVFGLQPAWAALIPFLLLVAVSVGTLAKSR